MKEFLSYSLNPADVVWPGEPKIEIHQCTQIGRDGNTANTFQSILPNHCGTHYDAPFHFNKNGPKITELPMEYFWFEKIAVLDIPKKAEEGVMPEDLEPYREKIKLSDLLLLKTGFYKERQEHPQLYGAHGPYLHPDVCRYLIQEFPNLKTIGFDFLSIGSPCNNDSTEAHQTLLGCFSENYITAIEDMNLEPLYRIDKKIKRVIAAPLRVVELDSSQVSVIAEFEE